MIYNVSAKWPRTSDAYLAMFHDNFPFICWQEISLAIAVNQISCMTYVSTAWMPSQIFFHKCFIHQLLVSTAGLGPGGLVGIPRFVTESRIHFRGCHRNPNHQTPQTPQNHRAVGKVQRGQTTLRLGPADLSFWGRLDVFTPQKWHFSPPRSDFWWFFLGAQSSDPGRNFRCVYICDCNSDMS